MNEESIIDVIVSGLMNRSFDQNLSDSEISQVMTFAEQHRIDFILFHYLREQCSDTDWFRMNSAKYLISFYNYRSEFSILPKIFQELKNEGIPVLGLKGVETCNYYCNPYDRWMTDVDILVKEEHFVRVKALLLALDYTETDAEHSFHHSFSHKDHAVIEVHQGLYNKNERHSLEGFDEEIWKDVRNFESVYGEFQVMELKNNIVYHCIHMTNHMVNGNFSLRQLLDLYYLVKIYLDENEFKDIIDYSSRFGLGKYLGVMIYIHHELFDLAVDKTFLKEMKKYEDKIHSVKQEILGFEHYMGEQRINEYRKQLANYSEYNDGYIGNKLRMFFPKAERMNENYSYAQKNKVLLVVAWMHRWINILRAEDISFKKKLAIVDTSNYYKEMHKFLELDKY